MKFLFVLFLIIFLAGPILRMAFRLFIGSKVIKEQKKYYEKQNPRRPEGEIHVDNTKSNQHPRTDDSKGQYIDFEEIK